MDLKCAGGHNICNLTASKQKYKHLERESYLTMESMKNMQRTRVKFKCRDGCFIEHDQTDFYEIVSIHQGRVSV